MAERNLTVVETSSTLATTDPLMRRLGDERRIWLFEHSYPGRIPELEVPGLFLINWRELWTTTEASSPGTTAVQASPGLTSGEASWRKY